MSNWEEELLTPQQRGTPENRYRLTWREYGDPEVKEEVFRNTGRIAYSKYRRLEGDSNVVPTSLRLEVVLEEGGRWYTVMSTSNPDDSSSSSSYTYYDSSANVLNL
jgi:hypothetical protein